MNLANDLWNRAAKWMGACLLSLVWAGMAFAQGIGTTTVQGAVYLANGVPGSGTVQVSWPAFTTASGQTVTAGRTTATIGSDGFLSVSLLRTRTLVRLPSGLYYTAVFHLSDGTTSTEYRRFNAT